jgi:hypothetical protein
VASSVDLLGAGVVADEDTGRIRPIPPSKPSGETGSGEDGLIHPHHADEWSRSIEGPFEEPIRTLVDEGERARAPRQSTPFVDIIDSRTRSRIRHEVRERMSASA